jgi:hypothetical protein
MTEKEKTCEDRIDDQLKRTITGIKALKKAMESPDWEGNLEENEIFSVLSTDYVYPHTFNDQEKGYYLIQFSWGGPQDELRLYHNGKYYTTIEYWFLDWFDGAFRNVTSNEDILWYVHEWDLPDWMEHERND